MTDRIILRHLAPVRHVPRGGRVERWSLVPVETPALLPSVSAGEVEEVAEITEGGYGRSPIKVFGHDGRLWLPAGTAEAMREVLGAKTHTSALRSVQGDSFRGNPWRPYGYLGIDPGEASESRKVVDDRRDRAAAEATRFAARDVLIAGDTAYARLRGPMLIPVVDDFATAHFAPVPFIRHRIDHSGWTTVASLARAPDVLVHVGAAQGRVWEAGQAVLPALAGIDAGDTGIEDVRTMAALLAWRAERIVEASLRSDPHTDETRLRMRRERVGLSGWNVSGAMGMIATAEIEDALRCTVRAMDALREVVPGIDRTDTRVRQVTAYVEKVGLPAIAATRSMAQDDADALIALAR